jgi:hypothetical protein
VSPVRYKLNIIEGKRDVKMFEKKLKMQEESARNKRSDRERKRETQQTRSQFKT